MKKLGRSSELNDWSKGIRKPEPESEPRISPRTGREAVGGDPRTWGPQNHPQ